MNLCLWHNTTLNGFLLIRNLFMLGKTFIIIPFLQINFWIIILLLGNQIFILSSLLLILFLTVEIIFIYIIDPQDFSNTQTLGVVKALYMGIKVKSVEVPFVYPITQKENELINKVSFMQKRKRQKWENLDDLVEFIKYLNNPKEPNSVLIEK